MFLWSKPKIEVIGVKNEVREIEEEERSSAYYGSSRTLTKTTKKVNFTIVLAVVGGELTTREFNGKWNLEDVRKWEEL